MTINDLKVGQFAAVNGSVVYRLKPEIQGIWESLDGCFIIQRHQEKTLAWTDLRAIELINTPQRKHVNNAIKQLKDTLKFKGIDNLSYVENLNILKNYLKGDIVDKE